MSLNDLKKPFSGDIEQAKKDLSGRLELLDKSLRAKKIGILEHGDLLEAVWNLYSAKHVTKK